MSYLLWHKGVGPIITTPILWDTGSHRTSTGNNESKGLRMCLQWSSVVAPTKNSNKVLITTYHSYTLT